MLREKCRLKRRLIENMFGGCSQSMSRMNVSMCSLNNLRVWRRLFLNYERKWIRNSTSRRCLCDNSSNKDLTVNNEKLNKVEEAKKKLSELLSVMSKPTPQVAEASEKLNSKLAKPEPEKRKVKVELPAIPEMNEVSKGIDHRLMDLAKTVGKKIGGEEGKKTESELLRMLKRIEEDSIDYKPSNLKDIISGMKVDKQRDVDAGRLIFESDTGFKRRPPPLNRPLPGMSTSKNILSQSEPLNIFDTDLPRVNPEAPILETWNRLQEHELKMVITHYPENAIEEMIRWTEEGKLWKYPIDNEYGLDEEAKVPFYEHVLLDEHLEGFPEKGPIRDFMELVLIGLSKNYHMSVSRKRAYIDWYREYINEKTPILKACGAI